MKLLFDSHAHLDDQDYSQDRQEVLKDCMDKLVGVINPGTDLQTSKMAVDFSNNFANIYAAVGFHPHEAKFMQKNDEDILADYAKQEKVVAIGEIGLDYYYDYSPRDVQKQVLVRQLDLARQLDLPLIIHDRDAHADILQIMQTEGKGLKGVFHCYSGSLEMAKILLKQDFYLSFGGSVTFKNAVKTVEVAQKMPIEYMLLETDSPYLTPVPFRGKRNNPCMVELVCQKITEIRNLEFEQVAQITTKNVQTLFGKIKTHIIDQ